MGGRDDEEDKDLCRTEMSCAMNGQRDDSRTKSDSDNQDDHLQTVVEIVAARTTIGTGRVIPLIHTCSS